MHEKILNFIKISEIFFNGLYLLTRRVSNEFTRAIWTAGFINLEKTFVNSFSFVNTCSWNLSQLNHVKTLRLSWLFSYPLQTILGATAPSKFAIYAMSLLSSKVFFLNIRWKSPLSPICSMVQWTTQFYDVWKRLKSRFSVYFYPTLRSIKRHLKAPSVSINEIDT